MTDPLNRIAEALEVPFLAAGTRARVGVSVGIACTADMHKRDVEIKVLVGCTAEEMAAIQSFLNSHGLGCVVISRPARFP